MARKNLLTDRMQKPVAQSQNDSLQGNRSRRPPSETEARKDKRRSKKESNNKPVVKSGLLMVIKILIAVACVYICFLIYGLLSTDYKYDATGELYPEILSVSDIHNLGQYEDLTEYYLRSRALYESILAIDVSLAEHPEKALTIAMDYTEQLEVADKLLIDLNAAEYDTRYSSMYTNIAVWTNNSCLYLQYISSAITNNNGADAEKALTLRDQLYASFASITANIANLADSTKGANSDIYEWSPESYIEQLKGED